MISREQYHSIYSNVNLFNIEKLAKSYNAPLETIHSILHQKKKDIVIANHRNIRNDIEFILEEMKRGKDLKTISLEIGYPSFPLCKIVIKHLYGNNSKELIRDPSKIKNDSLREQVLECIQFDPYETISSENIGRSFGKEYEFLLYEKLINLGVNFLTENDLHEQEYLKTPDTKLDVPILLKDYGKVINWIESKALFGDEKEHFKYKEDQYSSYKIRFGPGLVIYWMGFVKELNNDDPDILVLNDMPTNIEILGSESNKKL